MPRPADKTPQWLVALMHTALGNGLTQRTLADIMGVTQPNISKYLSRQQAPSINAVEKFLTHMGGDVMRALPGYALPTETAGFIQESAPPAFQIQALTIEGDLGDAKIHLGTAMGAKIPSAENGVEVRLVLVGKAVVESGRVAVNGKFSKQKPYSQ